MATLHHHPLCPHSRFVRLVLGELGLETDLIEENIWERSEQFLMLDPQGRTPVFVEDQIGAVPGAGVIAEYLDETRGLALGDRRLLPDDPRGRVEVRRLMEWFNGKMYAEVTDYLVTEKVFKRLMSSQAGGGAPELDGERDDAHRRVARLAHRAARHHGAHDAPRAAARRVRRAVRRLGRLHRRRRA